MPSPTTTRTAGLDEKELLRTLKAFRNGDFTVRMSDHRTGAAKEIAATVNELIGLSQAMTDEFARVGKAVGKEGRIGQRAHIANAGGGWSARIESLNTLIGDLVQPTTEMARVIGAVAKGDLSQKIPLHIEGRPIKGEFLRTAQTVNIMVDQLNAFASEVTRVAREVGTDGKLGGQALVKGVSGVWKGLTDNVNTMASNLTRQVRNIAQVTTAVAKGDLSKKITIPAKGEILRLKETVNAMVDQLSSFASEVTRVAREVGTDGKLGGQAQVRGVSGTWKDLTDNVNTMGSNLTNQVRNIAGVTTAVAKGDLSKKITIPAKGEILELKDTINAMVDQLNTFASEVTRVAREVGTEGKLGGQAEIKGVSGTWKNLTDNVNEMASNLTRQVRNIAAVTTAVAKGDLSKKITIPAKGEILELKDTINTMVDQLNAFAGEVTRVAREVGTDGKLGGQAIVKGVSGTWKDLTDNVNTMASNLTRQVRNIAQVTTAVAKGDLSKKITVDVKGEILELKITINAMVDQLSIFASEVTRVAREVGTDGKLGGQATIRDVSGVWKDLTDNVNTMASNLTNQVRNIAEVTTAVAQGDLSKKITVDVKGEILRLKNTINAMVDQLSSFASEVTRVAREVGTDGKLGGQADVKGVSGTWKDLTDNVNTMGSNLTNQVRNIAQVTTAVAKGDLSKKITVDVKGEILELKNTINAMVDQLSIFADEVTRVAREVGTDGKLGGQAAIRGVSGVWKDLTDNVNTMAGNLTAQVRDIAEVTTAVAQGDLSKKITVDVKGEILRLKNTINAMVDQLNAFGNEVTRVAREVGTDGKLGGQAQVRGVSGVWKDLTDNVNTMGSNLTNQVRGIARVVTAVANGDLKRKLVLEARGEIAALAETINEMIDTLALFAEQVTTVAREVGTDGKLGGQAEVPGAAGTWKDLTDNVNQLAANLTTQVRAIGEVATAVTKGDLTRSITVETQGEVLALKDNINEMIRNLRETTQKNDEQDWLKTNLAKFASMLQGQKDLDAVCRKILSELAPVVQAQRGVFYVRTEEKEEPTYKLFASYAFRERKSLSSQYKAGEGLIGQCAYEKRRILLTEAPPDYTPIQSGLGQAPPANIVVLPVLFEEEVKAVLELASLNRFTEVQLAFLDQLTESIGVVLNTIEATMRTEGLLTQSQSLTEQLQRQQEELQNTNAELEEKAGLLEVQKREVEGKNREVELAKQSVEEKAEQLALTSKYKSQFLANMSHELRTPLNSLLLLSRQLGDNLEGNLSGKQVEYAQTIYSSGNDLLGLINEILDLSKIESGTMSLEPGQVSFDALAEQLERDFRHMAEDKRLGFFIDLEPGLPTAIETDPKRLQQVLRNLLSNAFKFTEAGKVSVRVRSATEGWSLGHPALQPGKAVAIVVSDTGIGIPKEKHLTVFEAFQQVEGGLARKYGGTGLGLTISREIAALLGGEIRLESEPGVGSTFTFYLPVLPPIRGGAKKPEENQPPKSEEHVPDDRGSIKAGDRVVLIVEDDLPYANILLEAAHEHGFKGLIALGGETGLSLAKMLRPDAMTLDIRLPDLDGWKVLERIKDDPTLRHIPVQIVTMFEPDFRRSESAGAIGFVQKPTTKKVLSEVFARFAEHVESRVKSLLIVEPDAQQRESVLRLVASGKATRTAVGTGREALGMLRARKFDCMLLDPALPDMTALALLDEIKREPKLSTLPIIVYSARPLRRKEEAKLKHAARAVIVRNGGDGEELLQQMAPFLQQGAPEKGGGSPREAEAELRGKKVLIVDDDVRNLFAMTSALERYGLEVYQAESGATAIELLENTPVDVVLMDVMMPEMDGYETMRRLRANKKLAGLPIVAVTAKAMQGDRERCLEAGASDYMAKPIDSDRLLTMILAWVRK